MTDPNTVEPIFRFLIEKGSTAGLMLGIIYILIRKILSQYEIRIKVLEEQAKDCQEDRSDLHKRIYDLQNEHIHALQEDLKTGLDKL